MTRKIAAALGLVSPLLFGWAPAWAADGPQPPALNLAWLYSVAGDGIGKNGLAMGDVDSDGREEILAVARVANGHHYLYQLGLGTYLEEEWTSLPFEAWIQAIDLVQRPDGHLEILISSADELIVLDGATKLQARSFPSGIANVGHLVVRDLDADGDLELVVCGDQDLAILDYSTGAVVDSAPGLGCTALAVGQTDTDPQLEIALSDPAMGALLLDSQSLASQWADPAAQPDFVAFVDADDDGLEEIALAERSPGRVWLVEPTTNQVVWENSGAGRVQAMAVANVLGGDQPEVLYATESGSSSIRVVSAATGGQLDQLPIDSESVDALLVGQLDDDEAPEVAWTSGVWSSADDEIVAIDAMTHEIEGRTLPFGDGFGPLSSCRIPSGDEHEILTVSHGLSYGGGATYLAVGARSGRLRHLGVVPEPLSEYGEPFRAVAGNIDSDPQQEVCLGIGSSPDTSIACIDSATNEIQWRVSLPEDSSVASFDLSDLDGDSIPEVLVLTLNYQASPAFAVVALEGATGWLRWRSPDLGPEVRGNSGRGILEFGDVDGDGKNEIVAMGYLGGLAILSEDDGAIETVTADLDLEAFDLANIDDDPELDIVAGDVFSQVFVIDPGTGTVERSLFQSTGGNRSLAIGDLNRDGVPDYAVSGVYHLRVYDGLDPSNFWTSPYLGWNTGSTGELVVNDFDHDGSIEVAIGYEAGIALFEIPDTPVFADGFESGDTSAWSATAP